MTTLRCQALGINSKDIGILVDHRLDVPIKQILHPVNPVLILSKDSDVELGSRDHGICIDISWDNEVYIRRSGIRF